MARTNSLGNFLTDVADAIRTKKGSQELIAAADFDTEIENLPSGGGAIEEKDVNFYDYDGTLVNSYTKNEFLALTELPVNPSHEGLTAQGWNWTLSGAKTHVTAYGMIDIGQLYTPSDGKTKLYVSITDGTLDPTLSFAINGTATIDWGDESTDTVTGTSISNATSTKHTYSTKGDYVISIDSESTIYFNSTLLNAGNIYSTGFANASKKYLYTIYKVVLGNNINVGGYGGLYNLYYLKELIISPQVTSFGSSFLNDCQLKHITFTKNAVFNNYVYYPASNSTTQSISIGEGSTSLQDGNNPSFGALSSLKRFIVPTGYSTFSVINGFKSMKKFNIIPGSTVFKMRDTTYSIKKVDLSSYTNITAVDFYYNRGIDEIILPSTATTITSFQECNVLTKVTNFELLNINSIPANCFASCYGLISVSLPTTNSTIIPSNCFQNCNSLKNINIPQNIKTIQSNAFINCYSLEHLVLPDVTTLQATCFSNCVSMEYYDFSNCTTVPTVANVNAFNNIPSACKIIVPDDLYEDWIVADKWSTYASNIISKTNWDALQSA